MVDKNFEKNYIVDQDLPCVDTDKKIILVNNVKTHVLNFIQAREAVKKYLNFYEFYNSINKFRMYNEDLFKGIFRFNLEPSKIYKDRSIEIKIIPNSFYGLKIEGRDSFFKKDAVECLYNELDLVYFHQVHSANVVEQLNQNEVVDFKFSQNLATSEDFMKIPTPKHNTVWNDKKKKFNEDFYIKTRPALIIRRFTKGKFLILPLTHSQLDYPPFNESREKLNFLQNHNEGELNYETSFVAWDSLKIVTEPELGRNCLNKFYNDEGYSWYAPYDVPLSFGNDWKEKLKEIIEKAY